MSDPLVSILTPSLNQGRFLADCLCSVAMQSYSRVEHIVYDGGSTDETLALLELSGPDVLWRSEPDGGQAHAVNKAFAASTGEIVGWINSDDALFATNTIEQVVATFASRQELAAVYGDAAIVSVDGQILRHVRASWPRRKRLRSGSSPVSQPALFVRRSFFGSQPLLREDLHMTLDLELVLRLAAVGAPVVHAGCVLAVDRDHDARKVRTGWPQYEEEAFALAAEYGFTLDDGLGHLVRAWGRRAAGLPSVIGWSRKPFAGPWVVDGLPARVIRQLTLSHGRVVDDAALRISREHRDA